MSHGSDRASVSRHPQIERCEPRIVLASVAFAGNATVGDEAATALVGESDLTSLSTAYSLRQFLDATDHHYIREDYGLTGEGQTVVVIDSGIAYDHHALGGGFGFNHQVVGGWDFAENDADPYDDAPGGFHGTHVAGIIGSTDATHSGLAPGVDLVALRVFNDTGVSDYDWIEASLQWVRKHRDDFQHPVTTVNISIGTRWNSDQVPHWAMLEDELQELNRLGIFVSVAAGNNFSMNDGIGLNYPAVSPYVVPVGSVDTGGQISDFSQRMDQILAAPGESIHSTVPDFLYSFDGITDDFATSSGTSLAAPYVAGSSVLLRQAMGIVGIDDVNQEVLYEHFRNSADLIHDAVTDHEYRRINLRSALDTLMADDFGSSPDTAHSLATLDGEAAISGHLRHLDDVDYFTFVAGHTGTVRMDLLDSETLGAEVVLIESNGDETSADNFAVRSGETYTVAVRGSTELGNYHLKLVSEQIAEAEVRFTKLVGQTGSQIAIRGTPGDDLVVFQAGSTHRLVVNGRTYRLRGTERYELFFDGQEGADRVIWYGSEANDIATLSGTTASMESTHYALAALAVENVSLRGGGGEDLLVLHDSLGDDLVSVTDWVTTLRTDTTMGRAFGFDRIEAHATAGQDRIVFRVGDAGEPVKFTADRLQASLETETRTVLAEGFQRVRAYGNGEGSRVELSGGPGRDRFIGRPAGSTWITGDVRIVTRGFGEVHVESASGGEDVARLYDSEGNDQLQMSPDQTTFFGEGFSYHIDNFSTVRVVSSLGGTDRAVLTDGAGDDRLVSRNDSVYLKGDRYLNSTEGFAQVRVVAEAGGSDRALLLDLTSVETLFATDELASRLREDDHWLAAKGFASVVARNAAGLTPHREIDAVDFVLVNELLTGSTQSAEQLTVKMSQ